MKPFRIAVLGQGDVGTPLVDILHNPHDALNERAGRDLQLANIHRREPIHAGDFFKQNPHYYTTLEAILDDKSIDCVCDVMSGMKKSRQAISESLARGKHVVSANKAVLAAHWKAFDEIARESNTQLRFEAAVAGGIPVLNAISEGSISEEIFEMRGIVNGTTNYILTNMEDHGMDYAVALREAQKLGFAEAIPRADVEGHDSCNKLALMIAHAFGKHIDPKDIPTTGIDEITLQDIQHAKSMGCKIKLISRAEYSDGNIIARVGPELVLADSPLGQVPANLNAVEVRSDLNQIGNFYRGEGAGGKPTSSNVLTDIIKTAKNADRGYLSSFGRDITEGENTLDARDHSFSVSFVIQDQPGIVHQISGILCKYGINLNSIVQLPYDETTSQTLPFFITVEDTTEEVLQQALANIASLDFNVEEPKYIRFGRDDLWRKPHTTTNS